MCHINKTQSYAEMVHGTQKQDLVLQSAEIYIRTRSTETCQNAQNTFLCKMCKKYTKQKFYIKLPKYTKHILVQNVSKIYKTKLLY